jgi:spermidine synthase
MPAFVLLLLFASGACSLVYQVAWARMLTLVFGTTLLAVGTVLSAFMAGLALGGFLLGHWADRVRHPLRLFALLEVGVGLYALLFPLLAGGLDELMSWLFAAPGGQPLYSFVRFGLSFLLLLVPTVMMGATLPAVTRFAVKQHSCLGMSVGRLYAANTLGAVGGVLIVTFVLMEQFGLRGSTYFAAAVNLLVAGIAWRWGGRPGRTSPGSELSQSDLSQDEVPAQALVLGLVLIGFGFSGFAALGYELAWTRVVRVAFSMVSHYEFSLVLAAFLVGLALGSFLCSRLLQRHIDALSWFGGAQILLGVLGVLSLPVLGSLPAMVDQLRGMGTWWAYRGGVFAVSFTVMLGPTLLMGAVFPLVGRIYIRHLGRVGQGMGMIGGVNSLGAALGAFFTGFVLIPTIGTESSVKALAAINTLIGLAVFVAHPTMGLRRKALLTSGALAVVVMMMLAPSDVLRQISEPSDPDRRLVFYAEGAEGVITVEKGDGGLREMMLNGGGQVPTDYSSMQLFRLLGHLPLLLHPDPQDVLVVSLGGGIALGAVAQHELPRVTCVELVPQVVTAAREHFGPFNHDVLQAPHRPGVEIVIDDGRNYLLANASEYDVITGDATHPTSADSWVLYTQEFYQLCRARLREGGIMTQWLPIHGLGVEDYQTLLRTFVHVFPHATLWRTSNYSILLGSTGQTRIDLERLRQRVGGKLVQNSLLDVGLGDPFLVLDHFMMDEHALRRFAGEGPLNSDERPYISFAESYGRKAWHVLASLRQFRTPAMPLIAGPDLPVADAARLAAGFGAAEHALEGDIYRLRGDMDAATRAYQQALRINPADLTSVHFLQQLD